MKRTLVALIAAVILIAAPAAHAAPKVQCSSQQFRTAARATYQPWHERKTGQSKLRRLKRCAPNDQIVRQDQKIERHFAHGRAHAIRQFHRWTPFDGPGKLRLATPECIAYHESGLNWNAGGGMYGFLDSTWYQYSSMPGPAGANHLEQDRIAHLLWETVDHHQAWSTAAGCGY